MDQRDPRAQLAEAKTNVKHWRAKLLARYEHLWQEAMKAWHRSEEDRVKRKTESALPAKTPGSDLDAVQSLLASMTRKRTKTTERQSGNAALLAKAMEALKAIRELKGLDPLKQTEVTGPQGGPIQLTVREMTDEQTPGPHCPGDGEAAGHRGGVRPATPTLAASRFYRNY